MEPNENNSLAIIPGKDSDLVYNSCEIATAQDRVKLYNMLVSCTGTVKSMLNKEIKVQDIVIYKTDIVDEETGEVNEVPRTILVTPEGETYSASSWGVYRCVDKIIGIFGGGHFDEPITIIPKEVQTKRGYTINLLMK